MPNDCENKLIIKGTKEQLDSFISKHIKTKKYDIVYLDFNTIIPEPEKEEDCEKEFIVDDKAHIEFDEDKPWFNWYRYHCAKWGTKWNSYEGTLNYNTEDCEIILWFMTAWNPCIPIINKLLEMYPDLIFDYYYYEPGAQFAGGIGHQDKRYYHYDVISYYIKDFAIAHGFELEDEDEDDDEDKED